MPRPMTIYRSAPPKIHPLFNDRGLLCDTKSGFARVLPNLTMARKMAAKAQAEGYICHAFKDYRSGRFMVTLTTESL